MGVTVVLLVVVAVALCRGSGEFKDNSISKYYYIYRNGLLGCREPTVELRERNASAIFSGTIRDLEPSADDPDTLRATVEVKRVLKGGDVLFGRRTPPQRVSPPPPGDGRTYVTVEGLGSPKICRSFARKRDTRIFLVNRGTNGELVLNSSLERITMDNINRIDAVVSNNGLVSSTTTTGVIQSTSHLNITGRSGSLQTSGTTHQNITGRSGSLQTSGTTHQNITGRSGSLQTSGTTHQNITGRSGSLQTSGTNATDRISETTKRVEHNGSSGMDPFLESLSRQATDSSTTELNRISSNHDLHESHSSIITSANILDNNLDPVSEAPIVKSVHKGNEGVPPEDPCGDHRCLFGGVCVAATDGATCECPAEVNCSAASDEGSVCGSDGITYASECLLEVERCKQQTDIKILKYKACAETGDPCLGKTCSFGAQCIASLDGLTARCQCPEKCDNFGDSVGSDPLCGSDGRDYPNVCEMRKKGCEDMRDIEKKFDGKCDPCRDFSCPFDQLCQLDSIRRPVCRCGEVCPMVFAPVCGSNGKTYANECLMREDSCRRQADTRVIFQGECSSGQNPCSGKVCGAGEQCHVDSASEAWCICPPECPSLVRPVCGSNGRTYESECHLRRSACLEKEDVVIGRHGDCGESGPCSDYRCDNGGHCVVHNGLPMCACPICSEEYEPICGSDNFSYANECKLRHENCTTAKMITIRYRGRCLADVCAQKKCDFYSVCEIDTLGVGRCICPDDCEQSVATVCGSDRVTYDNECELRHASCKQQKVISIASNGACDPCDGIACEFGGRCRLGKCFCRDDCPSTDDPVCGSDGLTYPNECAMTKAGCEQKTSLEVLHAGSCTEMSGSGDFASSCDEMSCKFGGECELSLNGSIVCVCNFNCDALRSPVCGSDGRTYGNECQLKEDSCRRQIEIKVQPMDNCQDIDEELCDGEPALINPITGKEYNCNRGKGVCPAGSYCHKLGAVARCCKQADQPTEICATSKFGCCPDGVISAPGPSNAGCPNVCQCNSLGSLSTTCDPVTRQCTCRPGVGGIKCDRCNPNFWGLPKIAEGGSGCLPCGCSVHGSMRDDCEQMTGQCMCRPGISGRQCNICPNGKYLRPNGCLDVMLNDDASTSSHPCGKLCSFGASCRVSDGEPECVCLMNCSSEQQGNQAAAVCASDGITHASFCQMTLSACHSQKNVTIAHPGPCDADDVGSPAETSTSTNSRVSSDILVDADYPTDNVFFYGLLGDMCHDDSDCSVENSVCDNGVCSCKVSWTIASDNLSCKAVVRIPSFSGHSYIELKKLSQDGRETSIEIRFRPQRESGVLLYARGDTDFISIALKDGYIEFRYDLGSGQVFLKSSERVRLGALHRLVARQSERSASLKVNNDTEVTGMSRGSLTSLNVNGPIYLGGGVESEAEKMLKVVNISKGFAGCIHSLVIKDSKQSVFSYDLTSEDSPDVEKRVNVGNCSSLCINFPCSNGGTCLETDDGTNFKCRCLDRFSGVFCEEQTSESSSSSSCAGFPCGSNGTCQSVVGGGFRCDCPPGFTGDRCEKENVTVVEAVAFNGSTYLQYQNAISSVKKSQESNKFEIKFRSESLNGLLLLMHKSNSIEADYLAIAIRAGHVQVSLNLGKEIPTDIVFLSSSVNVTDGDWHTLMFSRANRQSQLIVDHKLPVVTEQSAPGATHLDTDGHLWIGGSVQRIHGLPGAYLSGFHGCIEYVKVDDRILVLVKDRKVRGAVSFCGTDRR